VKGNHPLRDVGAELKDNIKMYFKWDVRP